jgi:acetyl esterase/lipase
MKTLRALVTSFSLLAASPAHAAQPAAASPRVLTNVTFLAPDRAEKLDVYLPAARRDGQRTPAIVWIHGGGWSGGTKDEARAKQICGMLTDAGYVAVSIDYKLGANAWPQNLLDCKNAVRFLRAHAADYGVDPNRIAVAGGSAGGHLALMVGFTAGKKDFEPGAPYPAQSSAVRCVIDLYGPTNLLTRKQTDEKGEPTATRKLMGKSLQYFGATTDDAEVLRIASPVNQVTKNSVPVLMLHGRADPTVDYPQSEELARVLKQHGVVHELILLDGIGHTFDFAQWQKKPLPRDVRPDVLAFLRKHLGPPAN